MLNALKTDCGSVLSNNLDCTYFMIESVFFVTPQAIPQAVFV